MIDTVAPHCTLDAAELRERRRFVRESLAPRILATHREGLRVRVEFDSEARDRLREFIELETLC